MNAVEYALSWLDQVAALDAVEPSTVRDYRSNILAWERWLTMEPQLVTRRDVEAATRQMLAEGRAPSTVRKRMITMTKAFQDGVDYGDIDTNPFLSARRPKMRKPQHNYLPIGERDRLKQRIATSNSQVCVAAALALYAGLREGEVCGIMASDIVGDVGWVRRSVGRSDAGTYIKSVKNNKVRDFPIPRQLSSVVAKWVESKSITGDNYLLTGTSKYADPTILGRKWSSLCEVEGFVGVTGKRPTFHDLRHTYATVAITAGVDVKTVSSVLGHSSAAMTLDVYAVADPVAKRMSAEVVGNAI